MRLHVVLGIVAALLVVVAVAPPARAQVSELQGSWIIDGYRFDPGDRSPRGTIAYDRDANRFTGTYVGLKLPAERPELHAWLYDTRSKQAVHLGRVPFQANTVGKKKGAFQLVLPAEFRDGKFGRYEVVAFSAEARSAKPGEPSGSKIQPTLKRSEERRVGKGDRYR